MSEIFPPVANSAYLRENYTSYKTENWQKFWAGAPSPNRGRAQWVKLTDFTMRSRHSSVLGEIFIKSRYLFGSIIVQFETGSALTNSILSTTGNLDADDVIAVVNDFSNVDSVTVSVSVYIKLPGWDVEGYASISRWGVMSGAHISLNFPYIDVFLLSESAETIEPSGGVLVRPTSYFSVKRVVLWSELVLIGGAVGSPLEPSKFNVSSSGEVAVALSLDQVSLHVPFAVLSARNCPKLDINFVVLTSSGAGLIKVSKTGHLTLVKGGITDIQGYVRFSTGG